MFPTANDLVCADTAQLAQKMNRFKRAGARQLHLVLDFDRTLTVGRTGVYGDVTTWHILNEHLPPEGKARYHELFLQYRGLELDGTMTQAQAVAWWSAILDLFVEYNINMTQVENDFLARATIRPGVKELFEVCAAHNIPTVILSAGIKDIIALWARTNSVKPTIILATALQCNRAGHIRGWDAATLVHVLNKKEIGHPELTKIRAARSHAILIGDSLNDADMAEGTHTVLRLRVLDARADEKINLAQVRERTLQQFDAILETGNMHAAAQLVAHIAAV